MRAFYNEIDRYACDWLQNLMDAGLITPGKIDDRSITELTPDDVDGYGRCHFFAGFGGWERALHLAGWPDDRPVWTASPPCQPFSVAGKHSGHGDERHLWPSVSALIRERKPSVIFGEQVARAIGMGWLDAVASDLETQAYAFGAAVLPACSVGAPHIRNRLWFVAHARSGDLRHIEQRMSARRLQDRVRDQGEAITGDDGSQEPMADTNGEGRRQRGEQERQPQQQSSQWHLFDGCSADVADTASGKRGGGTGLQAKEQTGECRGRLGNSSGAVAQSRGSGLPLWSGAQTQRPHAATARSGWWATEPNVGRVAHGVSARVGKLRALGNAIVPQVASAFIRATMT